MNISRAHPRYAIELDAELRFADGEMVPGRTRNVSRGGFCILAQSPIALGTQCRVRLALVFPEEQLSEPLEVEGVVVWCTPVSGRHQIGIKFSEITSQVRSYLDIFMKFLEEGEGDE